MIGTDTNSPVAIGASLRELRVLVAEDWADCAESTAVLLRMWAEVQIAPGRSFTALEVAAACRPDVIYSRHRLAGHRRLSGRAEAQGIELAQAAIRDRSDRVRKERGHQSRSRIRHRLAANQARQPGVASLSSGSVQKNHRGGI